MTLDELLKQQRAWLEQAMKRRPFDKVDEASTKFPEEQRQRRMADLKTRIGELKKRREESLASYDRAIALEEAELKAIDAEKSPTKPPSTPPVRPQVSQKAERPKRK
jgi:hypothetical protein